MKTIKIFFSLLILFAFTLKTKAQDVFITANATVAFYSESTIENIDANAKNVAAAINIKNRKVYFKVKNTAFKFKSSLMEEHFNENYMESEKFPYSIFNGEIVEDKNIDLSKDGTYEVWVQGKLNIHGVEKEYKTKAIIVKQNDKIKATATFPVKIADHKIKVPSVVGANVAEEVNVKIEATLDSKK
jgi:hypothetical protein